MWCAPVTYERWRVGVHRISPVLLCCWCTTVRKTTPSLKKQYSTVNTNHGIYSNVLLLWLYRFGRPHTHALSRCSPSFDTLFLECGTTSTVHTVLPIMILWYLSTVARSVCTARIFTTFRWIEWWITWNRETNDSILYPHCAHLKE